jgi:hypothetical protein
MFADWRISGFGPDPGQLRSRLTALYRFANDANIRRQTVQNAQGRGGQSYTSSHRPLLLVSSKTVKILVASHFSMF